MQEVEVAHLRTPAELVLPSSVLDRLRKHHALKVLTEATFNVGSYVLLFFVALWIDSWWSWIAVWLIQGFLLSGFLGASHECAHGLFLRSRLGNRICGMLWSASVVFNFSIYKYYHLEHHKYTAVPGDTEPLGTFENVRAYFLALPTTGFFVALWLMSLKALCGRFPHFVRTRKGRRQVIVDSVFQLLWLLSVFVLTLMWPRNLVLFYWIPLLVYFPMVFFTSLPEHYGCDEVADPLCNTRTLSSNFLFRYMFWNGNYHAEHHVYPFVPSHNLPVLHALIGNHFQYRERSYLKFHFKLIRGLRRQTKLTGKVLEPLKRVDFEMYNLHDGMSSTGKNSELEGPK